MSGLLSVVKVTRRDFMGCGDEEHKGRISLTDQTGKLNTMFMCAVASVRPDRWRALHHHRRLNNAHLTAPTKTAISEFAHHVGHHRNSSGATPLILLSEW